MTAEFGTVPTPPILFRQFEEGKISREELQASMAIHARDLIEEMLDARKNPIQSYVERLRNLAAARKLSRKYSRSLVREVLTALGTIDDFPPAQILWNANHLDVPLHCFFRSRIGPVFRITKMNVQAMKISVAVEYGANAQRKTTREMIRLQRDCCMRLEYVERIPIEVSWN